MSDADDISMSPPQPSKRLAIVDANQKPEEFLGTATITLFDNGTVNLELKGVTDAASQRLATVVDFDALRANATGQRTLDDFQTEIAVMVNAAGLKSEDIPVGDFQLEMHFDLKNGKLVSTQKPLHAYATADPTMAGDIHKSIGDTFANIPTQLATKIQTALDAGDHLKAAEEVKAGQNAFGFPPNRALLLALQSINLDDLTSDIRLMMRERILMVAHQLDDWPTAAEQAEGMLIEAPNLTAGQKAELEMVIANAAVENGQVETAMSIWRRRLATPGLLNAGGRGWAWRNIGLTLDVKDPETLVAARQSTDAFLEEGDKIEAGKSMMLSARALLHRSPIEALKTLDEIEKVSQQEGLVQKELQSALLHARANRLSALGNHKEALDDALKAIELRRGIIGLESELISSLYLVQQEFNALGRSDEAKAHGDEADQLSAVTKDPHFELAKRVTALISNFDPAVAKDIIHDAAQRGNYDIATSVQLLEATLTPGLSDTQRLARLEATISEQKKRGLPATTQAPAKMALIQKLIDMDQLDRAEVWLKQVLAESPADKRSRNGLLDIYWKQERWGDAAIFLREQVKYWGEMPGLLFALGRSLFKSGNLNEAVQVLTKSAQLSEGQLSQKEQALQLREEALQMGGTVVPEPLARTEAGISREDFERALAEFCKFVKADKRMTFWQREGEGHKWVSGPERYAQNLLHTFLKGRFGERIAIYEEIGAGAGRLDIYVQLRGGLSVVVELKMCGYRYSSTYAASGEDQVRHYMENRDTHLGYLIVFDARLTDFGNRLIPDGPMVQDTVVEVICDVRPRVAK